MTKENFSDLLSNPELTSSFENELSQLVGHFPYFHTAQLLWLKSLQNNDNAILSKQVEQTVFCVRDRNLLAFYMNNMDAFRQQTGSAPATENGNAPIAESDKKSTGQLIDDFLRTKPKKIVPSESNFQVQLVEKLPDNQLIATETLAKVFAGQGLPERAIEIYEQLILKNPEKRIYFASRIDSLKKSKS
ncbi:MAG: hypothetical protein LBV39_01000 [Bacteroidales bacterium]|jgi:hypothetical protein|nr:hypothetical protein [Bacteroidales bacterium]